MKYDPTVVSLGLFGAAIALYVGGINPMVNALTKSRTAMTDESIRLSAIEMDIRMHDEMKKRIAELDKEMLRHRSEWISPMLDSYSMRAKSFVDTMAKESGLVNVEYSENDFRTLPIPQNRVPVTRTGRRSICIKALGDYAALVSFILRAEAELPLMTVQSLRIVPRKSGDAERQEITLIVEWPCEGREIK